MYLVPIGSGLGEIRGLIFFERVSPVVPRDNKRTPNWKGK
jgi:hypothetical protein